jgi:hypothetical protein
MMCDTTLSKGDLIRLIRFLNTCLGFNEIVLKDTYCREISLKKLYEKHFVLPNEFTLTASKLPKFIQILFNNGYYCKLIIRRFYIYRMGSPKEFRYDINDINEIGEILKNKARFRYFEMNDDE